MEIIDNDAPGSDRNQAAVNALKELLPLIAEFGDRHGLDATALALMNVLGNMAVANGCRDIAVRSLRELADSLENKTFDAVFLTRQ